MRRAIAVLLLILVLSPASSYGFPQNQTPQIQIKIKKSFWRKASRVITIPPKYLLGGALRLFLDSKGIPYESRP